MIHNSQDFGFIFTREQSSLLFEDSPTKLPKRSSVKANNYLKYERVLEGIPKKVQLEKESTSKMWKVIANEVLHPTPQNVIFQSIFEGYTPKNTKKESTPIHNVKGIISLDKRITKSGQGLEEQPNIQLDKIQNHSFSFEGSCSLLENVNYKENKKLGMFKFIRRKSCCCSKCGSQTTFEKAIEFVPSEIKNTLVKRLKNIQELTKPSVLRSIKTRFTHQINPMTLFLGREDKRSIDATANNLLKASPQQPSGKSRLLTTPLQINAPRIWESIELQGDQRVPRSAVSKKKKYHEEKREGNQQIKSSSNENSKIIFAFESSSHQEIHSHEQLLPKEHLASSELLKSKGHLVSKEHFVAKKHMDSKEASKSKEDTLSKEDLISKESSSDLISISNNTIQEKNMKSFQTSIYHTKLSDKKQNTKLLKPVALSKKHGYSYSLGSITVHNTPRQEAVKLDAYNNYFLGKQDERLLVLGKSEKLDSFRKTDREIAYLRHSARRGSEALEKNKKEFSPYTMTGKINFPKIGHVKTKLTASRLKSQREKNRSSGGTPSETKFIPPQTKRMVQPYLHNV